MRHYICTKIFVWYIHHVAVGCMVTEETMSAHLTYIIGVWLMSSGSNRSGKTTNSLFHLTCFGEECHNVTFRAAVLLLLYAEWVLIGSHFAQLDIIVAFALVYYPLALSRCFRCIALQRPGEHHLIARRLHLKIDRTNEAVDVVVESHVLFYYRTAALVLPFALHRNLMAIIGEWLVEGELKVDGTPWILCRVAVVWACLSTLKILELCRAYVCDIKINIRRLADITRCYIRKIIVVWIGYITPHVLKLAYLFVVDVERNIASKTGVVFFCVRNRIFPVEHP